MSAECPTCGRREWPVTKAEWAALCLDETKAWFAKRRYETDQYDIDAIMEAAQRWYNFVTQDMPEDEEAVVRAKEELKKIIEDQP